MGALSNNNDSSVVDLDRCIGCGVCAPKCPNGAIELNANTNSYTPPKNNDALYKKIELERYGKLGMLKMMPKMILGHKI
jgi:Fe-S-cluster-containing hydrogenase component 2